MIHILWNVLALLTFLTLLIGFFCTLIGTLGGDLISVVSFVVSEENLKGNAPILITEAGDMLNKCINGNGDITEDLGLNDNQALDSMEQLKEKKKEIIIIQKEFNEAISKRPAYYSEFIKKFQERRDYTTTNINLVNKDDSSDTLNLGTYLNSLNTYTSPNKKEEWKIKCNGGSHSCESPETTAHTNNYCIELKTCSSDKKISTGWYGTETGVIKDYAEVIDHIIDSIRYSQDEGAKSIKKALEGLNTQYTAFITAENTNLDVYKTTIEELTDIFDEVAGDGKLMSIVNCKFIGKNVKVILRYLDKALGKNFYSVGICLTLAGVALFISIAFTILLMVILDTKKSAN